MAIARPASSVVTPPSVAQRPATAPAARTGAAAANETAHAGPAGNIRRCAFRRVMPLDAGRRELAMYQVDCLHPSLEAAVPLGRLEAARAACAACTLPGLFRADED